MCFDILTAEGISSLERYKLFSAQDSFLSLSKDGAGLCL